MASVAIFIADPKQSQERLEHENVALREGIDRASMCDKIVGTSAALQGYCLWYRRLLRRMPVCWSQAKPELAKNLSPAPSTGSPVAPHAHS